MSRVKSSGRRRVAETVRGAVGLPLTRSMGRRAAPKPWGEAGVGITVIVGVGAWSKTR